VKERYKLISINLQNATYYRENGERELDLGFYPRKKLGNPRKQVLALKEGL
jgi:hypothetical protein